MISFSPLPSMRTFLPSLPYRQELLRGDRLEVKLSNYPMPTINRSVPPSYLIFSCSLMVHSYLSTFVVCYWVRGRARTRTGHDHAAPITRIVDLVLIACLSVTELSFDCLSNLHYITNLHFIPFISCRQNFTGDWFDALRSSFMFNVRPRQKAS